MAVVPIISQSWDTSSYVTPTRMNNIETNIATVSKATGVEYSSGVSVKDKIDEVINFNCIKMKANAGWNWQTQSSFTIECDTNNTTILLGGRNGKGLFVIFPMNNNENVQIFNNVGCSISSTVSNGHLSVTLSNPTSVMGSSCWFQLWSY